MSHQQKIMILGAGDLGRRVLSELAHSKADRHIQLVGRNKEETLRAANLASFCSLQRGYTINVAHAITDITDVERTAECIAMSNPDVIFLAASLQSWWVISTLPSDAFNRLYAANFGPWLPMHLVPVMKAMQAVKMAGSDAVVVNAAFPDAVHPALSAVGLSPHIGIGNVANNVPGIRTAAADYLDCCVDDIEVRLIAHHYVSHRLSRHGDKGLGELGLAVVMNGTDVTFDIDVSRLLKRLPTDYRRTGGLPGQAMTAASAVSVLEPLAEGRDSVVHAPAPNGLPGGYPVAIESGGFRLALPAGMSEEEAVRINLAGQKQDGISEIRPDGTILFEPSAMEILDQELGYRCSTMALSEAEERARELARRFRDYRARGCTPATHKPMSTKLPSPAVCSDEAH
ncbi:hypothetical protein [Streptomyces rhizosphaericus]|uniref:Saccharopine dehydrogenase NADP binding domain-containing protein n=1 Tax=Streptomyces rhizosphaericus TaxID=114699 RepID=A0A6G4ACR0_9ACTN|nr:hypothetical protein [Streptomyces rhizosphaericus]NEW71105.1 hypothetical protein [Streptomyces rhizosphaericus]